MTQLPLEMNFIMFYNVDTLSTTVRISSQVTLEIGQKIKNIMTVTKESDLLKLCKMIKVINEGVVLRANPCVHFCFSVTVIVHVYICK